jgi:hypothetical protein
LIRAFYQIQKSSEINYHHKKSTNLSQKPWQCRSVIFKPRALSLWRLSLSCALLFMEVIRRLANLIKSWHR